MTNAPESLVCWLTSGSHLPDFSSDGKQLSKLAVLKQLFYFKIKFVLEDLAMAAINDLKIQLWFVQSNQDLIKIQKGFNSLNKRTYPN